MSQTTLLTPSPVSLPPITYKGQPVVTTEMLAQAYGCSASNIRVNFNNNRERFVEGKHFFNLTNGDLREFRDCVKTFDAVVPARTRNLTLWLERGAARHAKMLNTDQAWDVFEMLEETFFRAVKPEPEAPPALDADTRLSKRADPERKELRAMVNAWVGCAPLHYAAASSIINAHFGVKGVDEMTVAQVKQAIEFVRGKIGEASAAPRALHTPEPSLRDDWLKAFADYDRSMESGNVKYEAFAETTRLMIHDALSRNQGGNHYSVMKVIDAVMMAQFYLQLAVRYAFITGKKITE